MGADEPAANTILATLRQEVVMRDDGRYVIYYSWPDDARSAPTAAEGSARPAEQAAPPAQEPWSPESGPTDV